MHTHLFYSSQCGAWAGYDAHDVIEEDISQQHSTQRQVCSCRDPASGGIHRHEDGCQPQARHPQDQAHAQSYEAGPSIAHGNVYDRQGTAQG